MTKFIITIITTIVVIVLCVFLLGGHVYMGADTKPCHFERQIAHKFIGEWIATMKPPASSPVPPTVDNIVAGTKIYMNSCAGCHGDKQHPVSAFGRSMYPPAPQFVKYTPRGKVGPHFIVIKHGVRWTGMPAWKALLTDNQIWQVSDFLSNMSQLPPPAQKIWDTGNAN